MKCEICKEEVVDNSHYWRKHKLQAAAYFQAHHPRYDKFDGSIIRFKSKDQYFSTNFNSTVNLRKWLESIAIKDAREYCLDLLVKRKEKKALTYSLTQVELRSLKFPGINYYNKIFGDYYKLCEELGLKNKFGQTDGLTLGSRYDNSYSILVDTREQLPLKFNRPIEVATLKFGDYSFSDSHASCNCNVERKSLADFVGTMTGGYERFEREIIRAKGAGAYLVIQVEEVLSNALQFNSLPEFYKKGMKITPDFVFRRVRDLIQKYDHIQFLFVNGRDEAAATIEKIFTCGCGYKKVDLQLLYDKGLL